MSAFYVGQRYVGRTLSDNTLCVIGDGDSVICTFSSFGANDARLIAAAPELLAALQAYMSQFGQALEAHGIAFGPAQAEADAQARAAIAKATGGSA